MPFNLAFSTEAVIPMKFRLSSIRVEEYNEDTNPIYLRANLNLIEETRERATVRMIADQQKVARYYNTKIKAKEFRADDLVLQRVEVFKPTE